MDQNLMRSIARRQFVVGSSVAAGPAALASLLAADKLPGHEATAMNARMAHHLPRARRVIWLTQAGAPSQLELFDDKPMLRKQFDKDLPESVRRGQRLTGMTSGQTRFPVAPSVYRFRRHGDSGISLSEILPAHRSNC